MGDIMEIDNDTIILHSDPENYENEIRDKCFTIRELSGDELREFKNSEISRIVIINNDTGESFERQIAGLDQWRAEYALRPNKTRYWREDWYIWWKGEPKRRGRPKMKGEEAVEEKRM